MSFIIKPSTAGGLTKVTRTSNTVLTSADSGYWISITSGTFTQTFDPCANLGSTWFVYLENAGTGDITLDPSGSETIDGLTSYIMYPGEVRLIQSDGIALTSIIISAFARTFTSSGTFTKPPGYSNFSGIGWGGGASGARSNSAVTASRGGGGGQSFPFTIDASLFGSTETITVGAGGTAYTGTSGTTHNAGGNSSIGSLLTINGATTNPGAGYGSSSASPVGFEGLGLTSSNTNVAVYGGGGCANTVNGNSNGSRYGGGGGGGCDTGGNAYNGGTSVFGGSGGNASSASNGANGAAPGGGGGATQTGAQSGAGGRGEVRIWGIM